MVLRLSASLIATIVFMAAGCSSVTTSQTPPSLKAVAASEDAPAITTSIEDDAQADNGLHCTSYRPTGSHRKITRCVTKEQQELERDAARSALSGVQGPAISAPTGP